MDDRIQRLDTPKKCETFARNALQKERPDLALEALHRALELRAEKTKYLDRFVADYQSYYPIEEIPEPCRELLAWASERSKQIMSEISPTTLASILEKHELINDADNPDAEWGPPYYPVVD